MMKSWDRQIRPKGLVPGPWRVGNQNGRSGQKNLCDNSLGARLATSVRVVNIPAGSTKKKHL